MGGFSFSPFAHFEAMDSSALPWFFHLSLWHVSFGGLQCSFCFLKAPTTTKASKSPAKGGEGGSSSSADFKMVSSGLTENQLQLSVEVSLTKFFWPPKVGREKGERLDKVLFSSWGLPLLPFSQVLTSHSCSEEGLEDAANVLLQLSRGDPATRDTVLKLLLNGARHLGYTLCKQIGNNRNKTYCFTGSLP